MPALAGCAYAIGNTWINTDSLMSWCYICLKFMIGLLNLISAVFLCYGVLRIRYIAKKRRGDDRLKVLQMLLHVGAFALYMVGTTV